MTTANLPRVPDGLRDLMKIYTKEVLREKPADLYAFSANFFNLIVGEKSHQTVRKYEPVQTYETIMKNRIRQQVPISMVFNIIPETLTDLIKQFIKAVLREKPENIYIFAQEYFQRLAKEKSGRTEYTKYATYEKSLKDKEKVSPVSKVTCECGRILSANKTDVGSPSATPVTPKGDEKRGVLSVSYLKSVVIIQRYFRRYLKQKKTDLTKKDKCNSVEYITSILIIQRQFRRILAKKRVEKLKVLRSQEPKAVNHTANYMRAVVIIQRHYRIFLKKKQEQNRLKTRKVSLATAAIIIQRAFRRMVAVHRAKRAASAGTDQAEELNDNASETGSYTSVSTALLSTESNELGGTNYEERVHQQIIHEDVEVENSNVAGSLEKEYFAEPISDEEKSIHLRKTEAIASMIPKLAEGQSFANDSTEFDIAKAKEEVEDEFIAIKKTEPEFKPKKAETTLETEEELISDEANIDSKSENEPSYESERSIDGQEPERKMSMEKIRNAQDLEEEMQSKMENDSVIKEPEDQQIETAERKLQNISKKGDDEETTPLKISGDIRDITQNIDENVDAILSNEIIPPPQIIKADSQLQSTPTISIEHVEDNPEDGQPIQSEAKDTSTPSAPDETLSNESKSEANVDIQNLKDILEQDSPKEEAIQKHEEPITSSQEIIAIENTGIKSSSEDTETSAPTRSKRSMEEIETEIDTIPETSKNSTEVSAMDNSMTKDIVHGTTEPTLSSSIEKEDIPKFNEKSQSPPLNTETKSIEETEPGQEQTLPSNQTEDDNNQKPTEESDEKVIVAETSLESIKEISKNITEDSSIHDSLENESPKVEHLPTNLNKSNEEENKTIMDPQLSLDKTPEIESPKVEHLPTNLSQSDEDEKNTTENVPIVMDAPEENLHENNIPKSNDHKSLEDICRPSSIETVDEEISKPGDFTENKPKSIDATEEGEHLTEFDADVDPKKIEVGNPHNDDKLKADEENDELPKTFKKQQPDIQDTDEGAEVYENKVSVALPQDTEQREDPDVIESNSSIQQAEQISMEEDELRSLPDHKDLEKTEELLDETISQEEVLPLPEEIKIESSTNNRVRRSVEEPKSADSTTGVQNEEVHTNGSAEGNTTINEISTHVEDAIAKDATEITAITVAPNKESDISEVKSESVMGPEPSESAEDPATDNGKSVIRTSATSETEDVVLDQKNIEPENLKDDNRDVESTGLGNEEAVPDSKERIETNDNGSIKYAEKDFEEKPKVIKSTSQEINRSIKNDTIPISEKELISSDIDANKISDSQSTEVEPTSEEVPIVQVGDKTASKDDIVATEDNKDTQLFISGSDEQVLRTGSASEEKLEENIEISPESSEVPEYSKAVTKRNDSETDSKPEDIGSRDESIKLSDLSDDSYQKEGSSEVDGKEPLKSINSEEIQAPDATDRKEDEPAMQKSEKNSSLLVNNQLIGTQNLPTNHIEIEKNTKKHPSANVKDKDIGTLSSGRLVPTPIAELQLKSFKNTNDDGAWYDVYVEPQNPLDKHSVNTVVEPSRNVSEQQRSVTQEHAASLERVPSYYTPKEIVEPDVPKAKTSVSFFVSLDSDDGKPTYKIPKRFQDQSKKATSKNTKTEAKDINKVEEPEATDSEEDIEVIEVSEGDPEYQQMNTKLQTILELNENEHPSDVNDPETGEMSPLKSKTNKGEPQEPEEFDNISEKPSTKLAKTDFDYENVYKTDILKLTRSVQIIERAYKRFKNRKILQKNQALETDRFKQERAAKILQKWVRNILKKKVTHIDSDISEDTQKGRAAMKIQRAYRRYTEQLKKDTQNPELTSDIDSQTEKEHGILEETIEKQNITPLNAEKNINDGDITVASDNEREINAALIIQKAVRDYNRRNNLALANETDTKQNESARKIQRAYRRYLKFSKNPDTVSQGQTVPVSSKFDDFEEKARAVMVIQRAFRKYMERKKLENLDESSVDSITSSRITAIENANYPNDETPTGSLIQETPEHIPKTNKKSEWFVGSTRIVPSQEVVGGNLELETDPDPAASARKNECDTSTQVVESVETVDRSHGSLESKLTSGTSNSKINEHSGTSTETDNALSYGLAGSAEEDVAGLGSAEDAVLSSQTDFVTTSQDASSTQELVNSFLAKEIEFSSLQGPFQKEVIEEPCIKKSASLVSLSQDADAEPPVLGQALESSLSETTSLDTLSADTIDNATVKLAKPEEVIEKMSQMRDSMSQSQSQSQERIHSNDPSFEEPVVRPMSALQEQSSLDIEDGDIIVYNRLQRDETRESSAQSDSVVFGDTDEDKAPELPKEEDSGRVHLMRHYTIAGDDPRGLFRSVTIDDAMEDPEPGRGINSTASFYLDDETSENIRKKMMAYSLSETDSDYFDPRKLSQEDFDIDTAMADAMGTSTETESTIVSAATKIQAGARGFLTRRRLRRASAGTKSSTLDTKASFGNDAISESLERFIEEEAAKKIQAAYRTHTRKRKGHTRKMEGISLESNLAARRQKLQRGDALRNDSTPDDEHSVSTNGGQAHRLPKAQRHKLVGDAKSRAAMELKWLKMRQNSMPVQIDCEVFRVIPKHMRKRIKSADADKRK